MDYACIVSPSIRMIRPSGFRASRIAIYQTSITIIYLFLFILSLIPIHIILFIGQVHTLWYFLTFRTKVVILY